jgi:nucleoside-triphosphatase THEP1
MSCRVSSVETRFLFIAGDRDGGKTTLLRSYLAGNEGLGACGFLSLANEQKTWYSLKDICSGEERLAVSERELPDCWRWGRFYVSRPAYEWANDTLVEGIGNADLLVFDEIGRMELAGLGFDRSFGLACRNAAGLVVATVRVPFLGQVLERYGIRPGSYEVRRCDRERPGNGKGEGN